MEGGLINMLIFYCTDFCKKMITAADYESTDDIVDRLDEHLTKCPLPASRINGLPQW